MDDDDEIVLDMHDLKLIEKLGFYIMILGIPFVLMFAFGVGELTSVEKSMGIQSMNDWLLFPYFLGFSAYIFGYLMGRVEKNNQKV